MFVSPCRLRVIICCHLHYIGGKKEEAPALRTVKLQVDERNVKGSLRLQLHNAVSLSSGVWGPLHLPISPGGSICLLEVIVRKKILKMPAC